jgi:hypothetical protein
LLKSKILICFGLLIHVQRNMDKSWMSVRRGTTQYNDGCRAFEEFAVSNCTAVDGKIYCSCKYCRNNQCHSQDYILGHLTGSRGMSSGYSLWYMHGETVRGSAVPGRCSSHQAKIRQLVAQNKVKVHNRAEAQNRVVTCTPCCVTPLACTILGKPSVASRMQLMKEPLEGTH